MLYSPMEIKNLLLLFFKNYSIIFIALCGSYILYLNCSDLDISDDKFLNFICVFMDCLKAIGLSNILAD